MNIDKIDIKFLCLDFLVNLLLAREFARSGDPAKEAAEMLQLMEGAKELMIFPGLDPAENELARQTLLDLVTHRIHSAKAFSSGEKYDPETVRVSAPTIRG